VAFYCMHLDITHTHTHTHTQYKKNAGLFQLSNMNKPNRWV